MTVEIVVFRNRAANAPLAASLFLMMAVQEPRAWNVLATLREAGTRCWAISDRTSDEEHQSIAQRIRAYPNTDFFGLSDAARLLAASDLSKGDPLHIAIDVSCMPRYVMATIFAALFELARHKELTITVLYSLAAFTPPPASLPPNEEIRPVHPAFAGWPADVASSTAIVVALGYEQHKAQGANEYFDPAETWVFMPRSPIKAYEDAVRENNKDLIETAEREGRCIDYEVDDPERTFGELVRVAASARARATPLILPFGPKVFFAISLFVPLLYEEIGVWLISGGDVPLASSNHVASGSLIAFDVRLRPSTPQTGDPI